MSTGVESMSESDAVAAFEEAFGNAEEAPVEAPAAEAAPAEPEALEAPEAEAEEVEAAPAEPEFEIEIDGVSEVIQGTEKIRETLARGLKAGRHLEETARVREALQAQAKAQEAAAAFQQAVMGDLAKLTAYDEQLEQWNKIDWGAAFESDPFKAMQMKEQRDQLREARNAKYQEINAKHEQFGRVVKETNEQRARAEASALLAKLPEWRNAEKAGPEKQAIARELADSYGFTADEINSLGDHRMLLVARDAMKYRELVRTKSDKVKQVRTAPPVVKPGTVQKNSPKGEFTKVRAHLRALGQQGNHKGQEAAFTQLLEKAYK